MSATSKQPADKDGSALSFKSLLVEGLLPLATNFQTLPHFLSQTLSRIEQVIVLYNGIMSGLEIAAPVSGILISCFTYVSPNRLQRVNVILFC